MADKIKVKAFIDDIVEVYKKHGLCISHEDHHGSFLVQELDDFHIEWLRYAEERCDE